MRHSKQANKQIVVDDTQLPNNRLAAVQQQQQLCVDSTKAPYAHLCWSLPLAVEDAKKGVSMSPAMGDSYSFMHKVCLLSMCCC